MGKRKVNTPKREDVKYWKKNRHLLTEEDFVKDVRQIFDLDELTKKLYLNSFADVKTKFIRLSSHADEIARMRRIENSPEGDKKILADLIDKALIEAMNAYPLIEETVTKKNLNKILTDLSRQRNLEDLSLKAMEPVKELLIKRVTWYMEDNYPIYFWLKGIRGIGEKTSAKLLSIIVDIRRFQKPSQLLSYFGMGDPETGKMRKGVQAKYNPAAKSLVLGIIAENLIKLGSDYKFIYNRRKARTSVEKPEWTQNHRHIDARRVMAKRFMCELYDAWYRSLGMEPPAKPYGTAIQGHNVEPQIYPYIY
ncbi:MAG TPA: transposase [Candidatus Paceibacterota bacterium]|nr:transposase [Candidatus Paceibacterota bacterium]